MTSILPIKQGNSSPDYKKVDQNTNISIYISVKRIRQTDCLHWKVE